jgi:SAM-dependent methyltransferase
VAGDVDKEMTIASYDRQAEYFAGKFRGLLELHKRYEFEEFEQFLPGKRILDVGCGAGDHSLYFMNRGLSVTAIDISPGMVALAKAQGVDAKVMDMEDMAFPQLFDGIWAVTSLLHIPKARAPAVISRMHDLLDHRGMLYLCMKRGDGEGMLKDHEGERFFAYYQPDELRRLCRGFELVDEHETPIGKNVFLQYFFRKPA